ncbi:MAG: sigma-70 family RNA polymerase sigma factor [Saprospiraceae bacterium]|nr:sigma-70 family RNA polymerase sigma factor [Saprospiraceae bacterium]
MDLPDLIDKCRQGNRQAQATFYQQFAPVVLGACRRYLPADAEAEDAMIQSMFKSLTSLDTLRDPRTIHGWIRRIAVNECLMILRKKKLEWSDELPARMPSPDPDPQDQMQAEEVLSLLKKLPLGYRTIFNLYVLEGYTHKEIGELLDISLNTSKSQLIQARKRLATWISPNENKPQHEIS